VLRRPVRRWYAEPRIAEAVLAIGHDAMPTWPAASYDRLASRFKGFGAREERLAVDAPLARHGAMPCPPGDGQPYRVWRVNQDGHRAAQWGPGVVAYNVLAPYGHFEDHLPSWSNLVEAYLAEERPVALGWAEQRYVDVAGAPRAGHAGRFYVALPHLPDAREHRHSLTRLDVDAAELDGGSVAVSLVRIAADPELVRYQLTVVATSRTSLDPDVHEVMRWHNVSHHAINAAFERVITNDTRKRMRQV